MVGLWELGVTQDAGRSIVLSFWQTSCSCCIDYMAASHGEGDHYGGWFLRHRLGHRGETLDLVRNVVRRGGKTWSFRDLCQVRSG